MPPAEACGPAVAHCLSARRHSLFPETSCVILGGGSPTIAGRDPLRGFRDPTWPVAVEADACARGRRSRIT
ncbi:hypothetical protein SGPA1_12789 [Streptomyces misionensis JCM 4497]